MNTFGKVFASVAVVAMFATSPVCAQEMRLDTKQIQDARFGGGVVLPIELPDLAITQIKQAGSLMLVTVNNVGEINSPPTSVRVTVVRRSDNQRLARVSQPLKAMAPGNPITMIFQDLPISNTRVYAKVDPKHRIRERKENNNVRMRIIGNESNHLPDLAIQRIARDHQGLIITVANRGFSNSPVSKMQVSVRRKFDMYTFMRKTVKVGGIPPRGTAKIRIPVANLSRTDVFADIDPARELRELNDNNNSGFKEFNE